MLFDRGLNKFVERGLAHSADFMVFTNEATADGYKAVLGRDNNIRVIPHLTDIDRLYAADFRPVSDMSGPVVLYYIGGFHKNIREPNRLFNLIKALNKDGKGKYLLKIYGPLNGYQPSELAPVDCPEIMYKGPIAREKAVEILKTADAIVNIDNQNCIMTPSKVVECISTGRPLINITNGGIVYSPLQVYEESGYLFSLVEEKIDDDVVIAVKRFLDEHRCAESAPLTVVKKALESHALETIANQYLAFGKRQ